MSVLPRGVLVDRGVSHPQGSAVPASDGESLRSSSFMP